MGRQLPSFQMSTSFSFFTSAFLLFFTSAFIAEKNLTFFREKNETIFLISYVMMVWLSPLLWIDLSFLNRTGEEKKVKNPWVKIDCLLSLTTAIQHFYPFLNPLSLRCHHPGCWAIHALREGCWSQLEPAGAVMGQPCEERPLLPQHYIDSKYNLPFFSLKLIIWIRETLDQENTSVPLLPSSLFLSKVW